MPRQGSPAYSTEVCNDAIPVFGHGPAHPGPCKATQAIWEPAFQIIRLLFPRVPRRTIMPTSLREQCLMTLRARKDVQGTSGPSCGIPATLSPWMIRCELSILPGRTIAVSYEAVSSLSVDRRFQLMSAGGLCHIRCVVRPSSQVGWCSCVRRVPSPPYCF